jgi:broad specificity phosphatase PhoE
MLSQSTQASFLKPRLGFAAAALLLVAAFIPGTALADAHGAAASGAMTLYVVRHGQTDWNAQDKIQGNTDNPLNATGLRQAEEVAAHLGAVQVDQIYPSALARAIQTAEAIAAGIEAPVTPNARLNERSRGIYEGRVEAEVKAEFQPRFAALDDDMDGGESLRSIAERVGAFTREMVEKHMGQTVMVVGHSGVNPLVIGELIDLPPERAIAEIKQGNDEVYKLQVSADGSVSIWKLIPKDRLDQL